jgi:uncharacterized Fe-S cluster-containing protein
MRSNGSQDINARSTCKKVREDLLKEQKKLEDMVSEMMEKGDRNMGEDTKILKQSGKLDKLIVDEMMLREMKKKYPKKDN